MSRGPMFSYDDDARAPDATSPSLIERLGNQSADAWRRLVAIYSPLIYRWCRGMGVTQSDAADVTQEVFRSVAGHVGGFRRSQPGDSFRGWLYAITRNKSRDYLRRHRDQPQGAGGSDAQRQFAGLTDIAAQDQHPIDDPGPTDDDKRLLVVRVLDQLRGEFGEQAMTSFWRMVVDGHSAADIARDLETNAKAVRQAKYRVLQRLRRELQELD